MLYQETGTCGHGLRGPERPRRRRRNFGVQEPIQHYNWMLFLARMRFRTFVVSSFGSLGTQALGPIKDIGRRTNLFVPPALAHETSWATMSITSFLRSASITFKVRKRVAVFLRDHLPHDFIPPPPHAITACGDVNDVDHGDLNGTPST